MRLCSVPGRLDVLANKKFSCLKFRLAALNNFSDGWQPVSSPLPSMQKNTQFLTVYILFNYVQIYGVRFVFKSVLYESN